MKKGEFGLIGDIRARFPAPEGVRGIGDDCAIIPQHDGMETVVSTDMLVEGAHFLLNDISAWQLGWKSAAVNFSDLAAMGSRPTGSFLAFALPKTLPEGWIEEFMRGYRDISEEYGVPLLGGDTTSSPDRLSICVTVLGECPAGVARCRSYAKPGDLVCVTGTLGDSAAGLAIILEALERNDYLVRRHYEPTPRLEEGMILAGCEGVHAMMDISDGIASDIRHIMEESGVGARVDLSKLPLSDELRGFAKTHNKDINKLAVSGGEDYELLFTMDPSCKPEVPYTVIGEITEGSGLTWLGSDADYQGFAHF